MQVERPFSPCRFVNRPTCPVDPKSKKFNGSFFGLNLSNPYLVVHMNNDTFPPYCRTRPPSSDPESPTESFRPFQSLYRGTSPIRNRPPRQDDPGPLGTGLMKGPGRRCFRMSEVPLYIGTSLTRCSHPPGPRMSIGP